MQPRSTASAKHCPAQDRIHETRLRTPTIGGCLSLVALIQDIGALVQRWIRCQPIPEIREDAELGPDNGPFAPLFPCETDAVPPNTGAAERSTSTAARGEL